LQDLTPVRLNLLYAHLLDHGRARPRGRQPAGLSRATVATVQRMLRRALAGAVRWGYVPRNLAEDARPPAVRRRPSTVWTPAQLRVFVAHIRDDRLFALHLLVVTTGDAARRGGRAASVQRRPGRGHGPPDPTASWWTARPPTGRSRPSRVSGRALDPVTLGAPVAHVDRWERERDDTGHGNELQFCHPDGSNVHPDSVTDWFQQHACAAGLPVIRLHAVRHSYGTAALRSGCIPRWSASGSVTPTWRSRSGPTARDPGHGLGRSGSGGRGDPRRGAQPPGGPRARNRARADGSPVDDDAEEG
jgi:hypothetical protein